MKFSVITQFDARYRARLRLEAEGHPDLLQLIEDAIGTVLINRFRIESLLAVGRQSFVFSAVDILSDRKLVVKQSAFDYRKPLLYDSILVTKARESLKIEHKALASCTTGHLPQPVELVTSHSIIPAAEESSLLVADEVFLVQEYIHGVTITELALKIWPSLRPANREYYAQEIVRSFIEFWTALQSRGWVYGDINTDNLIIEEKSGRLRVVDAGSAVPSSDEVTLPGWTPAFTTPNLYDALARGKPVPGGLATVLPPLAKVIHFCLTKREQFNGMLPDLDDQILGQYSPRCKASLSAMLLLDEKPESMNDTLKTLHNWLGGLPTMCQ